MRRTTLKHWVAGGALLSFVVFVFLFFCWPALRFSISTHIGFYREDTYAVYLDTGHIFYGALIAMTDSTIVLKDVRSFQKYAVGESTTNTLQSQTANPLTRPDNFLAINRSHVLFFEKVGGNAPILNQGVGSR